MTNISSLKEKCSLSGTALKVIAIIAMTIDHLAWMGIVEYSQAEVPVQIILHCIGRLTAPIMFFFVAEGYHHTRNYWKYLLRMALLAAVSHFASVILRIKALTLWATSSLTPQALPGP